MSLQSRKQKHCKAVAQIWSYEDSSDVQKQHRPTCSTDPVSSDKASWMMVLSMRCAACSDAMIENLTVYEMLIYTAELKLSMDIPVHKKKEKVAAVLDMLALNTCRDVRIGSPLARGISGRLPVRGKQSPGSGGTRCTQCTPHVHKHQWSQPAGMSARHEP